MKSKNELENKIIKIAEDMGFYTRSVDKAMDFISDEIARLSSVEKTCQEAASMLNGYNDFYDPNTGDASLSDIFTIIDKAISKFNVDKKLDSKAADSENLFNKSYDDFRRLASSSDSGINWSEASNRSNSMHSFNFGKDEVSESSDDYIAFSDSIKEWTLSELISKSMAVNAGDEKIKNVLKILFDKGYIK